VFPDQEPSVASEDAEEAGLPFDPWTLAVGMRARWRSLALAAAGAAALGVFAGQFFGKRLYSSQAVMLYSPNAWANEESAAPPTLETQLHMVKLPQNLAGVRRRLELGVELAALGAAIDASVQRETSLLTLRVTWGDPEEAAAIARALREEFLERMAELRQKKLVAKRDGLGERLAVVQEHLGAADRRLQEFRDRSGFVDLDKETGWYLDEVTELDVLHEQARIEARTVELQAENISRIIGELKSKVAKEKQDLARLEPIEQVNLRLERLQESIQESRKARRDEAALTEAQAAVERARRLFGRGVITRAELEKTEGLYRRVRADAVDPPDVKEYKRQIRELDKVILPEGDATTPAMTMLHDMMMKDFQLRLDRVSAREKIRHLGEARDRVRARLEALSGHERHYVELSREVATFQNERETLEADIAAANHALLSDVADFGDVALPSAPRRPVKSNRRTVAVAVSGSIFLLAAVLAFLAELLAPRLRSARDAEARTGLRVLAALPAEAGPKLRDGILIRFGLRLACLRGEDDRAVLLLPLEGDDGDLPCPEGVAPGPVLDASPAADVAALDSAGIVLALRAGVTTATAARLAVGRLRDLGVVLHGAVLLDVAEGFRDPVHE
jgi:uncharacterized protein involved in exopolysaccharide biosynthesis